MTYTPHHIALLRLARTKGVGPATFHSLMQIFNSPIDAVNALPELCKQRKRKVLTPISQAEAEQELEALTKLGGCMMFYGEEAYPPLLAQIPDAPIVLSVLGDATHLHRPQIAIVGNRNASLAGKNFTQELAQQIVQKNHLITSGLARGIDTAAHTGALQAHCATIACVAGGVDHIYPPENKQLREDIIANGCVVAENPLGTKPTAQHFPRRNRIISGLSRATVVTEASRHSGSLITAQYAGEQGREVFAVPGNPMESRSAGPNHLIKQGASILETVDDLFSHTPLQQQELFTPKPSTKYLREEELPLLDTPEPELTTPTPATPKHALLQQLSKTPIHTDELVRQSGLNESEAMTILMELELDGHVMRHAGGLVSL